MTKKISLGLIILVSVILMIGCSTNHIVSTYKSLPKVYSDHNATHLKKKTIKVSLFRLNNYTDTPRAGMRAANILEGILVSRGYKVISHIDDKVPSIKKAKKIAKKDKSKYFMYGGVSEWRYKTGIDGEPAVSLQLTLYKTKKAKKVWSATGANSDWGNGSIGETAQDLIEEMMNSK